MTDGAIDSTHCALQLPAYHMALALVVDADESGALAKSVMKMIGFQYFYIAPPRSRIFYAGLQPCRPAARMGYARWRGSFLVFYLLGNRNKPDLNFSYCRLNVN
jgi:hypothetical protein